MPACTAPTVTAVRRPIKANLLIPLPAMLHHMKHTGKFMLEMDQIKTKRFKCVGTELTLAFLKAKL